MAIPAAATALIGRDGDVRALALALRQSRLVTLLGPGGVGKTRLALELASELETEFERVRFIDLTAAAANPLLADHAAGTAGAYEALDACPTLLVFDNCEHNIENVTTWIAELMAGTRTVVTLTTSRRPLHIATEQLYPVRPLSIPLDERSVTELLAYESVQLFVERAVQTDPAFQLTADNAATVAEICQRAEGLPVAIELAAGLTRSRTLRDVASAMAASGDLELRRRDMHPHQQSLTKSIDWSLQLLTGAELQLLRCAAIFPTSFTGEAISAVYAELDGDEALALVILDHELNRYRILDVVARTVRAGTDSDTDHRLREAHGRWAVTQARAVAGLLNEPDPDDTFKRFTHDAASFAQALAWFDKTGQPDRWLEVLGPIATWWVHQGQPLDPQRWLVALSDAEPSPQAANLRLGLAYHYSHGANHDEAEHQASEALHLAVALGLDDLELSALNVLGNAHLGRGDRTAAAAAYQRALDLGVADRYPYLAAMVWVSLARLATEVAPARGHLERAVAVSAGRFPALLVAAQQGLARLELAQGNTAEATGLATSSAVAARDIGFEEAVGTAHNTLGAIALHEGDLGRAATEHRAAVAIGQRIGHAGVIADALVGFADLAAHNEQAELARTCAGKARDLVPDIELPDALAVLLDEDDSPVEGSTAP
ncbi:MAG: hypothetical protein ACC660_00935, partial [Acidimicrobiales bacterium]